MDNELKYTVTFPTIWRSEYTMDMLKKYSECPHVEEIILIDNAPEQNKIINIDKVKHIREESNTYAIPGVNKGVAMAVCDNVIISSDDIEFDVNVYCNILNGINKTYKLNTLGYIGSHSHNYEISKLDNPILLQGYNPTENISGWGCLVTINKEFWTPIPSQLKIWYGDNWLQLVHRNKIFQLKGIPIKTKMSSSADTSIPWVKEIIDNDTIEWHKILIQWGFK